MALFLLQHWECKLLMSAFMFVIGANYMWIFVEALYLHMIIFVSVFSDRKSVLPYILIGWSKTLYLLLTSLIKLHSMDF